MSHSSTPWWEEQQAPPQAQWRSLQHHGVLFPPPYEPLPANVKLKYNEAEEFATFYASVLETEYVQDTKFNENFFKDFKEILMQYPPHDGTEIVSLDLCNFSSISEHITAEKARTRAASPVEKAERMKAIQERELPYATCLVDDRIEKVGNFRVEPPGLFRGRGDHPQRGKVKLRLRPEDVTLNLSEGVPIPVPNIPGQWKAVIHDNKVAWLATWTENVNGNHKYVFLGAPSILHRRESTKFDYARDLKDHIVNIRETYTAEMISSELAQRQRATAMYLIDKLGLSPGPEKVREDLDTDTIGCCALSCQDVSLESPNFILFDWLTKSNDARYPCRVSVDPQVFENIQTFKKDKNDEGQLFDHLNALDLNQYLLSFMRGLSSEVFKIYNASTAFQRLLDMQPLEHATPEERITAYRKAQREVALRRRNNLSPSEEVEDGAFDASNLRDVAVSTSELLYFDPRITVAWCKLHDVPLEKLFNDAVRQTHDWAMKVEDDWKF
ncbi:TOPEUc domain-containing protein [Mycena chlorophos]|uniref:DNA topoisomerase 1 n=1 Tax=Mycena chlorophos TaxID=658473 RepID=A0A8H6VUH4_MYCCL|nr:TOPEUc domain-containing protein [Mycena chlorophos]